MNVLGMHAMNCTLLILTTHFVCGFTLCDIILLLFLQLFIIGVQIKYLLHGNFLKISMYVSRLVCLCVCVSVAKFVFVISQVSV